MGCHYSTDIEKSYFIAIPALRTKPLPANIQANTQRFLAQDMSRGFPGCEYMVLMACSHRILTLEWFVDLVI